MFFLLCYLFLGVPPSSIRPLGDFSYIFNYYFVSDKFIAYQILIHLFYLFIFEYFFHLFCLYHLEIFLLSGTF